MSAPRLQDVLAAHKESRRVIDSTEGSAWACTCGEPHNAEHQAAVWREACTVRTVEQLDALPDGSVVWCRIGSDGAGTEAWKKADDHLTELYGPWYPTGGEVPHSSDEIPLPALLVWHPAWEATS